MHPRNCLAIVVFIALSGCADQQADTAFRLQKAEADRNTCRQALNDEKAKSTALNEKLQAEERQRAAAQAELGSANARIARLQEDRDKLGKLVEQRAVEPLKRPEVPVSPLPNDVDNALQTFATKYERRVWYERGRGAVSFANDQLFEAGSDALRPDANAALYEFAAIAAQSAAQPFDVLVVGHTDDVPITKGDTQTKHPTNWHLSVHRAIAVKDVLEKAGVPAARLGVMGFGAERPAAADRARNRRVEVFLVRKGEIQSFAPVKPPRK